jgi:hypothetical protein
MAGVSRRLAALRANVGTIGSAVWRYGTGIMRSEKVNKTRPAQQIKIQRARPVRAGG